MHLIALNSARIPTLVESEESSGLVNPFHPEDNPRNKNSDSVSDENEKYEIYLRAEAFSEEYTTTQVMKEGKKLLVNGKYYEMVTPPQA
ncbi:hypothetical protein B5X24_HaOG214528 [Helicoverpa armigera]|uniref:Uncharacterized protein n=1 Tax=Helicoverpa armigera TaxID=29058 RepID=A0A2W1B2E5_HELAM|nr:hypothetical protein B5X24_HaOG214528 [Helicoverpa armigera]